MSHDPKIIDRLRKLLELSARGDEHEAQVAAQRAAELMAKHQIDAAMVAAASTDEVMVEDGRIDAEQGEHMSKRIELWHRVLVVGIAEGVGGRCWRLQSGRNYMFWMVGPPDTVRAARYMYMALSKEIGRLGRAEMKARGETNSWRRAYQRGMSMRVVERIRQGRASVTSTATGTALVHVSRQQKAVDDAIAAKQMKASSHRAGHTMTPDAIVEGYVDGADVDIGAADRAALGAGKKQLR